MLMKMNTGTVNRDGKDDNSQNQKFLERMF